MKLFQTLLIVLLIPLCLISCNTDGYYGKTDTEEFANLSDKIIVIDKAVGGNLLKSAMNFNKFEREGKFVVIRGECASACLLVLTHNNVCYYPGSTFVFHGVFNKETGKLLPRVSEAFRKALPGKLPLWVKDHKAMSDPNVLTRISGETLSNLDKVNRLCKS